jgi:RHS repeat-associated protein
MMRRRDAFSNNRSLKNSTKKEILNSAFITSYERDNESGLDYAQARYYSNQYGRFTSVDPLMASAKASNPKTWNRYSYTLNNPLKYIDPDGMDVNILDDNARELVLLTLPEKIREKVKSAIEKGNGKLTQGALNKIKSKDENFLALKFLVDQKEVTEAATSDTGVVKFFMTTWEKINDADEKAAAEQEGITVEEAKKKNTNRQFTGPTGYLGQTYSPQGEDNVPRSPSGNLRAVATDGTGDGITKEDAVVTMAHELYGHAYLFRKEDKNWHVDSDNPNTFIRNVEERTKRNYRGEQKKDEPKNLKPKQ